MRVQDEDDPRYGAQAIHELLAARGIEHEMLDHPPTFRALDEAEAVGVAPAQLTKTLVAVDGDRSWLVVIPAPRRLDLDRLREHLGASRHLRLATEDEIATRFSGFDVGATPPFGAMLGVPEIVDIHVLDHERVVCSAGDHQHAVRLKSAELLTVGAGTVADVCAPLENGHWARVGHTPLH